VGDLLPATSAISTGICGRSSEEPRDVGIDFRVRLVVEEHPRNDEQDHEAGLRRAWAEDRLSGTALQP
jgi:hypothetical protein